MKILDIRGNLVKIECSKPIQVSSLLKISDSDKVYLAQVLYAEHAGIANVVFAKVLSYFNSPFTPANITDISKNSKCEKINLADIGANFGKNPTSILGELAYENIMPVADEFFFTKRILIVSENNHSTDLLLNNFSRQIINMGYNTLIFDTEGTCGGIKLTAGIDFKLPLNEHSIDFIYEKYFCDITDTSKAQVSNIFSELKIYASTVPYIPFKAFKMAIDNVFNYSQNLNLFFFRAKLEKLYESNIFANTSDEIMNWQSLSEFGPGTIIIDLSLINKVFIGEYISLILNSFKDSAKKLYAFAKLSDSYVDKDFLKGLIENKNVITSCIVNSNFKFLPVLKQYCGSYLIMGGIKKIDNFDYCKFLLKNLPRDKYIITGSFVTPLSLIFQLKEINEIIVKEDFNVSQHQENSGVVDERSIYNESESTELSEENIKNYEPIEELQTPEEDTLLVETGQIIEDYEPTEDLHASNEVTKAVEAELVIQDYEQETTVNEKSIDVKNAVDEMVHEKNTDDVQGNSQVIDSKQEEIRENDVENELHAMQNFAYEPVVPGLSREITDLKEENESNELPLEISNTENEQLIESSEDYASTEEIEDYTQVEENLVESDDLDILPNTESKDELELDLAENIELSLANLDDNTPELLEAVEDPEQELRFANSDFYEREEKIVGPQVSEELGQPEKTPEEILDEQIKRDVDKVYMAPHQDVSDELSEDDLDFIEELVEGSSSLDEDMAVNDLDSLTVEPIVEDVIAQSDFLDDDEKSSEPETQEEVLVQKRNTAAPVVPIYAAEIPAEAIVQSDPIQQGDRVIHVKFGIGVVEKIFSYGTKNFCSINFENIGRKVLDPNVTELKKA